MFFDSVLPAVRPEPGMEIVFQVIFEKSNLIEYACASIFVWAVLGGWKELKTSPLASLGKLLLLYVIFLTAQLGLSALTLKFRNLAGIGTWLSALIAIVLYAVIFCPYRKHPAVVTATVAYTTVILVIEYGAVLGRYLAERIPGFDAAIPGYAANIFLVLMSFVILQNPIWKYYVSIHAVRLNLVVGFATTLVAEVFDFYAVHFFERGGDYTVNSFVAITFFLLYWINFSVYIMTYHLTREQTKVLELTTDTEMNKGAKALIAVTEANLEEFHKINHDLKNQYAYMQVMLQKQDNEGLKKYFE